MKSDGEEKIKMLNSSIRCFVLGLFALLPVIGPLFAFVALWVAGAGRAGEKKFWNAARPYRLCGIACASVGAVFWSFADMLIITRLVNAYINSNS